MDRIKIFKGVVCKTVGFSKGHSEDPDAASLRNPAVYENRVTVTLVIHGRLEADNSSITLLLETAQQHEHSCHLDHCCEPM